ncbi:Na+/H+ antiporter subunit E [Spirulina sp. 06S082]|uniref:Na+/H+ antiporter subunit E n=1 Tax=Spirulina sp. 06S082 TaxID=3110248 RepID=UPI002B21942C|nr:Na+/H+ antiporter subunit E [Spirulina sp. 06S082]MEA5469213.1 Na+/H+ antiporter subunit E [Spirulina sp. 06S082]
MVGHLILRLTIWFLLTADLSWPNILIGLSISLLLPRGYTNPEALKDWLLVLGKILWAIPQAYIEAFDLILRPHNEEDIILEQVEKKRSHRLVFLDILLITFTPKTIVVKYDEEGGWYEVHRVIRRKKQT